MQEEFSVVLTALEKYKTRDSEYNNKTLKLLENLKRFYDEREMIINAFKNKIFSLYLEENMFWDEDEDDIMDENGFINYKKLETNCFKRKDIND